MQSGKFQKPSPTASGLRKESNLLRKLSIVLLPTYKAINKKYYGEQKPKAEEKVDKPTQGPGKFNDGFDNEEGEYIVTPGEYLGYDKHFQVVEKIGNGQFGQVVKAWDKVRRTAVAVKIIKNRRVFLEQAQHEIAILNELQKHIKTTEPILVRFQSHFFFRNHLCLVFELLSYNLYEVLVITRFQGLTLDAVRNVAEQLLKALLILEDAGVIHCDVKPENVLLCDPEHSYVKLIDFGSSCFVGKTMYTYVQSRFYRAVEVILQLPYGTPIDMWSLGCLLVELHTGEPIFNGSSQGKQLGRFHELLGELPAHMIEAAPKKVQERYFDTEKDTVTGQSRFKLRKDCIRTGDTTMRKRYLDQIVGANTGGPDGRFAKEPNHLPSDYAQFMSVILAMLQYDPAKRIRASEALKHPFITMSYRTPKISTTTPSTSTPVPTISSSPAKVLGAPSTSEPAAVKTPAQAAR